MKLLMAALAALLLPCAGWAQTLTRGIGVYPGAPQEHFSPTLKAAPPDGSLRNLALHRQTFHSSSYDYNLTAQLVTDGIADQREPVFLEVNTPEGPLGRREREWSVDCGPYSSNLLTTEETFLDYTMHGYAISFDSIQLSAQVAYYEQRATQGYTIAIVSDADTVLLRQGSDLPGTLSRRRTHSDPNKQTTPVMLPLRNIKLDSHLGMTVSTSQLRLTLSMTGADQWWVHDLRFFLRGKEVTGILPSHSFRSQWMSNGGGQQWLTIDLGATADISHVKFAWVEKPGRTTLQLSDDNKLWTDVETSAADDSMAVGRTGRYVRVLMEQPGPTGRYALSEAEVWGRGGLLIEEHPERGRISPSTVSLAGGNWRLCRADRTTADGASIASPDFDDNQWLPATVPATVLSSYMNIGAVPNTNFGNYSEMVSESYFMEDFWYRRTFKAEDLEKGQRTFLCFKGINWQAEVYLNGKRLGHIGSAFLRSEFDVTALLRPDNVLAVRIIHNEHYGAVKEKNQEITGINGGLLGADNPTFHASVGWDWITTVRGRNMGIYDDVLLCNKGTVSVADPLIITQVERPDTTVNLTAKVFVTNHDSRPVSGTLCGWIGPLRVEKSISLQPGEQREVCFLPTEYSQLRHQRLPLWWPNGYGAPSLHKAGFAFYINKVCSDSLSFMAGLRQMEWKDENTRLQLYINGRRFVPLGGNWGFPEHNLNYRAREYDVAVDYHRQMNFTMIRNWVGQTPHDAFYEACDRYGIMVWQDFWLANPSDGPDPYDNERFARAADDLVRRIRNHASIALYCGRNEGYPPKALNERLADIVSERHPGMPYIPSSADDGVSGHGPYSAQTQREYFRLTTPKLHTERGMPNVMNIEGLRRTIPEQHLWPQDHLWGQHDFTLGGAQGARSFNAITLKALGEANSAEMFTRQAQWTNYNGYRAMYESNNVTRSGLLIWMSHPAFPSLVWQTYDYFFEPTAAFFACKKACEPLHIQWNALSDSIEVVNTRGGSRTRLTAKAELLDMYGTTISTSSTTIDSPEDTTFDCLPAHTEALTTDAGYLRLSLSDSKGQALASNFYVVGREEGNYQALAQLPKARVKTKIKVKKQQATVILENRSDSPALILRLNLKGSDGEQILPATYSDNYFSLMPGEKQAVSITWRQEDTRNRKPVVEVTGFNL